MVYIILTLVLALETWAIVILATILLLKKKTPTKGKSR